MRLPSDTVAPTRSGKAGPEITIMHFNLLSITGLAIATIASAQAGFCPEASRFGGLSISPATVSPGQTFTITANLTCAVQLGNTPTFLDYYIDGVSERNIGGPILIARVRPGKCRRQAFFPMPATRESSVSRRLSAAFSNNRHIPVPLRPVVRALKIPGRPAIDANHQPLRLSHLEGFLALYSGLECPRIECMCTFQSVLKSRGRFLCHCSSCDASSR